MEQNITEYEEQKHHIRGELRVLENETRALQELCTMFRNFSYTYHTLYEETVKEPLLSGADKQNIERSAMFLPGSYSERHFLPRADVYTLSSYLHLIKEMIESVYATDYVEQTQRIHQFFTVIAGILNRATMGTENWKTLNMVINHLYSVFPELKEMRFVRMGGTKKRVTRSRTKKRRGGYSVEFSPIPIQGKEKAIQGVNQCYEKEVILRSVCAILYAAYQYNQENAQMRMDVPNDDDVNDIVLRNEKSDVLSVSIEAVLMGLLTKLHHDEVAYTKEVDDTIIEKYADEKEIYYYYIPFVKDQIMRLGRDDLLSMYNDLLHESDITISNDIASIVSEFVSSPADYDTILKIPSEPLYQSSYYAPKAVDNRPVWRSDVTRELSMIAGSVSKKKYRKMIWRTKRARRRDV
jgi:hypothetical protein